MFSRIALSVAAALVAVPLSAHAGPADYVNTPMVEQGEKEFEVKFGTARGPEGERESALVVGGGYGVTAWWSTELYAEFEKEGSGKAEMEAVEWENRFQLTEAGEYWLDLGFLAEVEIPVEGGAPWQLKVGPLLQKEFGATQLNLNVLFERQFGSNAEDETELEYNWQAKYRYSPGFEFGLQGFGALGEWNDWKSGNEQEHSVGPAIFGKVGLGEHRKIKYDAALLFGATDSSPDNTLRFRVEYEF